MDDWRLQVRLDRVLELSGVELALREWPGVAGPLIHLPDPGSSDHTLVALLAQTLAPRYRIMSLTLRPASAYQVDAADLLALCDQFGFAAPILLAERLGSVPALLHAAWFPHRTRGLVLVDPSFDAPLGDGARARALRDCPPNWTRLRRAVDCPLLELAATTSVPDQVSSFLAQLGPGPT